MSELLEGYDELTDVQHIRQRGYAKGMSKGEIHSTIIDQFDINTGDFESLSERPLDPDEELEDDSGRDHYTDPEVVLHKFAEFAYENGYSHLEGCVAFHSSMPWTGGPEDSPSHLRGFGLGSDGSRYVIYDDGNPWHENLNLYEAEQAVFVAFYMNCMDYAYVEPWRDGPFWIEDKFVMGDIKDWPPDVGD